MRCLSQLSYLNLVTLPVQWLGLQLLKSLMRKNITLFDALTNLSPIALFKLPVTDIQRPNYYAKIHSSALLFFMLEYGE